ncbi:Hypothetical protein NTJ_12480 [Nesidiocoris tenuis]|uniref:Uncharacterized protein n=1 Tax=Nesidiocoris tenuis TaxID=355587 RepID=A0ABN7B5X1_9HEMI|nr:Hypothetical protein NTJ_12480 [Nesidiocoris tenuis]
MLSNVSNCFILRFWYRRAQSESSTSAEQKPSNEEMQIARLTRPGTDYSPLRSSLAKNGRLFRRSRLEKSPWQVPVVQRQASRLRRTEDPGLTSAVFGC